MVRVTGLEPVAKRNKLRPANAADAPTRSPLFALANKEQPLGDGDQEAAGSLLRSKK